MVAYSFKKILIIMIVVIVIVGVGAIAYPRFLAIKGNNLEKQILLHQTSVNPTPFYIQNRGVNFKIRISDNDYERDSGLSGVTNLADNEGMLFVFEKPDYYAFWMKDMIFPLDIIWLDKNFNIVTIKKDLLPSTYPNSYKPSLPAMYVLEINAGLSDKYGFQVGDQWQAAEGLNDY